MKRDEALEIILSTKIIAIIRMSDSAKLLQVADALRAGGVRALEVTMTTPGALEAIKALSRTKAAGVLIGAGTVLDAETALATIRSGADFVVSPVTDFETIRVCRENGIVVAPGAMTPTEIVAAWNHGADIVKVFPATSVGTQFFRELKGPLPGIRLMPTGGVNAENARAFIEAGACAVAVGTAILDKKAIETGAWDVLVRKAQALVDSLRGF